MKTPDEDVELHIRPRPSEAVSIRIPSDTLAAIHKIAQKRDMSYEALLRFYIGQGLRQDLATQFSEQVLEATAEVLAQHLKSEGQVSAIIEEIRGKVAA